MPFLNVDTSFVDIAMMTMVHVLVNMDLREGLAKSMELRKVHLVHVQYLDYEGITLRCNICHKYWYQLAKLPLPLKKKIWFKKNVDSLVAMKVISMAEGGLSSKGEARHHVEDLVEVGLHVDMVDSKGEKSPLTQGRSMENLSQETPI